MQAESEKVRTQDGSTYCSVCGGLTDPEGMLCDHCGALFEGEREGAKCLACNVLLPPGMRRCLECGNPVEGIPDTTKVEVEKEEAKILYDILRSFPVEDDDGSELQTILRRSHEKGSSLMDLSEPLRRVALKGGEKLQVVERILRQAEDRLGEIEGRMDEVSIREREALQAQVRELAKEKEELLEMRWGMAEIERVYRNLLLLQGMELERRERWFRERMASLKGGILEGGVPPVNEEEARELLEDIQSLEAQLRERDEKLRGLRKEAEALREAAEDGGDEPAERDEDLAAVLRVLDELLEKLPDKEIKKFAKSKDFPRYEKVLAKYVEDA